MTEDELQALLEMGDMCTETHAKALKAAYALGRVNAIAETIAELDSMDCSMSARDAAVDFRQTYESERAEVEKAIR